MEEGLEGLGYKIQPPTPKNITLFKPKIIEIK
jgi:hypothetical protein